MLEGIWVGGEEMMGTTMAVMQSLMVMIYILWCVRLKGICIYGHLRLDAPQPVLPGT